jgi:arylsulfatase
MEGKSLLLVFQGKSMGDRKLSWEQIGNHAALEGKWKLVSRYTGKSERYDLEADRTELNDLAATVPDRAAAKLIDDYDA